MKCRWIENIKEFQDIAPLWDKALIASGSYNPFLLSDFIITWWKHYGEDHGLCIFVVYKDERVVGGIPLYIQKGGIREGFASVMRYIGGVMANYTEPLYAEGGLNLLALLIESLAERRDCDALHLTDIRGENRLISEYQNHLSDRRFSLYAPEDHINFAIDLSIGKDNYMRTLPKKLKQDLRAKRKHLIKNYGELKFKEIKEKNEIEHYFDLYIDFSIRAFKSRNIKSSFQNLKYTAFFKEFLVLMSERQRLDAHALLAGDKILAITFGYRFGKGYNWILTAFNYEFRYFRPGYLLTEELIDEVCKRGETNFNWYGHGGFYKKQWCNRQAPLCQFFLIKRTPRGLRYKMLKRTEIALRSNEHLMNLARKLKKAYVRNR